MPRERAQCLRENLVLYEGAVADPEEKETCWWVLLCVVV